MRASTLLGLAIALFLGVAAVVGIRISGVLSRSELIAAKTEPVMVLVAKHNLFEGTVVSQRDVMTRPATAAEIDFVNKNKDKIMPAYVEAASERVPSRSIGVSEILLKDDFLEQGVPDVLTKRLEPGMRSVSIVLPKERAGGGLLRIGEYVDVYLTTTICTDKSCTHSRTATAPMATHLKIVVKRDNLWTVMQADPEGKPVSFILQANPYRAALLEFAKTKGTLTLIPSGPPDPKDRSAANSVKEEAERVAAFLNGDASVSDLDLARILKLQPLQFPESPLAVEHYRGVSYVGTTPVDSRSAKMAMASKGNGGYVFLTPSPSNSSSKVVGEVDADCPTCHGKK